MEDARVFDLIHRKEGACRWSCVQSGGSSRAQTEHVTLRGLLHNQAARSSRQEDP